MATIEELFRLHVEGSDYLSADHVDWSKPVTFHSDSGDTWYEYTGTNGREWKSYAGRIR